MNKKIVIVCNLLIMSLSMLSWRICESFLQFFHFSFFDLSLRLIESSNNDGNIPIWQVRIFHNKLIGSVFDVFTNFTHYWDSSFLLSLISPLGLFGLCVGLWYMVRNRDKKVYIVFIFLLIGQILQILSYFPHQFSIQLLYFFLAYFSLSSYGLYNYVRVTNKKTWIVVVGVLVIVSMINYIYFHGSISSYCATG